MFSLTQEYALRAIVWLAQHPDDGLVGHARIAEETAVPASYLSKILQGLAKAGLLTAKRGVGGGFQLASEPESITVLEVIEAVEPIRRIKACPLGLVTHRHKLCPMHYRLDNAMQTVEEALGNSTIREVMSEPGRPTPLVETKRKKR